MKARELLGRVRTACAAPGRKGRGIPTRRGSLLLPLIVGSAAFLQAFDGSAVIVALPAMAGEFAVRPLVLDLVITAYISGAAASLPLCSWAAERFGTRLLFMLAIIGFALGSLACGLAGRLDVLIAARFMQGAAGALLLPVGRIIVLRTVPKTEFVRAMAFLTTPLMLGPMLGPPVAGLIVTAAGWRWLFLLNLPLAAIGVLLVRRYVGETIPGNARKLDVLGLILVMGCLLAFNDGISLLSQPDPPGWRITAILAAAILCGCAYVRHARLHPEPVIDLRILAFGTVAATNLGGLFTRMLTSAMPFLLALLFQIGFKLSPVETGSLIFAAAFGSLFGRFFLTRLVRRFGFRHVLLANGLLVACSTAVCGLFSAATPLWLIFLLLFIQGALRALQLIGLGALSYADVEERYLAHASIISSLSQQIAMGFGIAMAALAVRITELVLHQPLLSTRTIAPAFVLLAAASLLALPWIALLHAAAGHQISGRRMRGSEPASSLSS